jgi:serine/threonine protein kinase
VPGYQILGELGRSGMGVVYKARHLRLDRVVALKMVLVGGHAGQEELARFRTEAEAVARLRHPGVVQIYDFGDHEGLPYLALEYCEGGSLATKVNGTPLPPRQAATLVEQVARAVDAAHQQKVIHRDLKPANVLLAEDGTPKVTDFGLAKKLDQAGQTVTGAIMGTPSYMAPEQASGRNRDVGPATDVYSLGAILYELLTGRPPFKAVTVIDTLALVLNEEPIPPARFHPRLPRDMATICLKCLEKRPEKRYDDAQALADDLRRFLDSKPILARPPSTLERFGLWCHRPERIRDAGAFTLFLSAVFISWELIGITLFASGICTIKDKNKAMMMMSACVGLYIPLVVIGWGCVHRKVWAFWIGVIASALILTVMLNGCFGLEPITSMINAAGLYSDTNQRVAVFTLLSLFAFVQFLAYCIAIVAYHHQRKMKV